MTRARNHIFICLSFLFSSHMINTDEMVGEVVVPPSKKLEDLIRLAELCVDLLRQNEEFYAEVRLDKIYFYKYHSAFVTSQRKKDMFKCSPFDKKLVMFNVTYVSQCWVTHYLLKIRFNVTQYFQCHKNYVTTHSLKVINVHQ